MGLRRQIQRNQCPLLPCSCSPTSSPLGEASLICSYMNFQKGHVWGLAWLPADGLDGEDEGKEMR